jgi:methyl-accepting chemotaxis protein
MSLLLLALEVSNNQVAGAVVGTGSIVTVSGILIFLQLRKELRGYIRQEAGVKDTAQVSIAGQPLEVREAVVFATTKSLAELERDTNERLQAVETYTHNAVHELRQTLQSLSLGQQTSAQVVRSLETTMGNLTTGMKDLSEESKALNGTVERLDERTETTNSTVAELSRKIDLILTKLPK